MKRILAFLIFAVCALACQAMTVEVQGRVVFATGPVGDDIAKF